MYVSTRVYIYKSISVGRPPTVSFVNVIVVWGCCIGFHWFCISCHWLLLVFQWLLLVVIGVLHWLSLGLLWFFNGFS
jgi:hypothetical protein